MREGEGDGEIGEGGDGRLGVGYDDEHRLRGDGELMEVDGCEVGLGMAVISWERRRGSARQHEDMGDGGMSAAGVSKMEMATEWLGI